MQSQPEEPVHVVVPLASILDRIDLTRLFSASYPLEVELGSGDGSFLARYAQQNPQRNFIGIERLLGRARKLERKSRRLGLRNVRCVRIESAYFLEYLLPLQSASAIHLYFPDPWPKRKHQRHRIVNDRFPALLTQALVPGGLAFLRTDHPDYFQQMLEVFAGRHSFTPFETPAHLKAIRTDFEEDFQARGIPTLYAAYRRVT